ncbi:DUF3618 domain-containing protein [Timonella sp. A28]|uniref:DUF3618 domain-containing protein n=1 Tax=Timonella sp. A28 TaxID=3442640 RepID=UPI003EBCB396
MSDVRKTNPEVQAARDELAAALDELISRVTPRNVVHDITSATKLAASDAASFVTGGGLPHEEHSPRRSRNAKILLGVAAGGAALLVLSVLTARRK